MADTSNSDVILRQPPQIFPIQIPEHLNLFNKTKSKQPSAAVVIEDESASKPEETTTQARKKPQRKDQSQVFAGVKQVASRTVKSITIVLDTAQDSDKANEKAPVHKTKIPDLDKDGFSKICLYFYPAGEGPKQEAGSDAFAC
ncbi:hypothetical protein PtB15_4B263 [Puccinia triticina]|nr:hypothetical protein PtB15_4B263 [Puccinia triticina]